MTAEGTKQPKLPWYEAHRGFVTSVVQNLVEHILQGSGRTKPRVRKKSNRGRSGGPSDFELELLDPSVLPMAEQSKLELSSAMESFAMSYFSQVDKKPDPNPITNSVTLVLPATAPIVTCVKVCLTHIPPSFECIAGRVLDWHDARLRLSKWIWKSVKMDISRTLGHRLYGDLISESNVIFAINQEKSAVEHVELNCSRLGIILNQILQSSSQSILRTFSQHYTSTDHIDPKQSRTLLDAHFIKHLAPSIIARVGEACHNLSVSELARRQGAGDDDEDSDASSIAASPSGGGGDDKFAVAATLGRQMRRRRGAPTTALPAPELNEFLSSLPTASRMRLDKTLIPDAILPSTLPDFKVPNLLRWKIADRNVPRPSPYTPRDVGEDVRSSDVDWQIIRAVLVYLRQRGVDMLGSSLACRFWQLGPLHVEGDPSQWDTLQGGDLAARRVTRKRRHDNSLTFWNDSSSDPPVWGIDDLRDFVEGRPAWDDPGLDPDVGLAEDDLGHQIGENAPPRKRGRAKGPTRDFDLLVGALWPENALALADCDRQ